MGVRRLSDVNAKIMAIVEKPVQRGHETGFKCLNELYTVKMGSFTIWHGSPAHGKSEIIFEVLMNEAEEHNEICAIYSPETGFAETIYIELAHKYLRKQIVRHNPVNPVASERDMFDALAWVDDHFVIFDDDPEGYSFPGLCEAIAQWEKENGRTISHIMAEPYNELVHDMKEFGGRQDLYIEGFLTGVRRYAQHNNKHVHLSFHTGQQQQQVQKDGNISFYPMPKAREAAGGQAALRKAMTWINIWRPLHGLKDRNGQPYAPNEVLINVEKAKPKYVSYRGQCSLYFDVAKNRYYEKIGDVDSYAYEFRKLPVQSVVASSSQALMNFEAIPLDKIPQPEDDEDMDLPF